MSNGSFQATVGSQCTEIRNSTCNGARGERNNIYLLHDLVPRTLTLEDNYEAPLRTILPFQLLS